MENTTENIFTIYKIHKDKMLLSPKTGKPYLSYNSIIELATRLGATKTPKGNWEITQGNIDRWNNAVKVIQGLE